MRLFDAYLFADWSASSRPRCGRDSIWIGDTWFERTTLHRPILGNPRTRREAEELIAERVRSHLEAGRRVLVGFDFSLSLPAAVLERLFPGSRAPWTALWTQLEEAVRDGASNANNRFEVAAALNERLGERWFWGCPPSRRSRWLEPTRRASPLPELRLCEQALRAAGTRPFPARQLFGNGAVGGQMLVGIPTCARLRKALDLRVWPFETGLAAPERESRGVIAEIWPGAIPVDLGLHGIRDAAQMRSAVEWAAACDAAGTLGAAFAAGLGSADRAVVESAEGWVLAAPPRTSSLLPARS